jgi:hypothetical protein
MTEEWLTYREAAERLGSTAEAVRYRAQRGRWPRTRGNDGRARIQLPEDPNPVRTPSAQPVRTPSAPRADAQLINSLQEHVATLKEQLSAAELRLTAAEARAGEEAAKTARAIQAFADLADRLDALAAVRRPWWRRIAG